MKINLALAFCSHKPNSAQKKCELLNAAETLKEVEAPLLGQKATVHDADQLNLLHIKMTSGRLI
jgi:hypothetical protein